MDSEGFRNVPVTKLLVPIVGGCSSLVIAYNLRPNLQIPAQAQLWRFFASQWGFQSLSTTFIGTWLIYRMKIIEQRYGSSKYAALIFISFIASSLVHTGAYILEPSLIPNGPLSILFSVLYQYQKIVPPTYQMRLLGLPVTDKSYVYLPAVQLLLSNSFSSFFSCFCGFLIGSIYDNTTIIKQWRFPTAIRQFVANYLGSNKKKPTRKVNNVQSSVKEEDVQTMSVMFPDYSRHEIEKALRTAKSDLNRATDILLTSSASSSR